MNIQQLDKLDRRELTEFLTECYQRLTEANQTIREENQKIYLAEGFLHDKRFNPSDPEVILDQKILSRIREGLSIIERMKKQITYAENLNRVKARELSESKFSPAEIERILDKRDHAPALAKIAEIEAEIVILQKYQNIVKTAKPVLEFLRGTFLENWTVDTDKDFHPQVF